MEHSWGHSYQDHLHSYKKNNVLYLAVLEDRLNPAAMFVAQLDENIEEDGHAM